MGNVEEVRWRLLWEQVRKIYQAAQSREAETLPEGLIPDPDAEILLRLAGAVLTLLDWHDVAGKGRCRVRRCVRRRWLPWRTRRICPVFATVQFWMRQPLSIVQKVSRKW